MKLFAFACQDWLQIRDKENKMISNNWFAGRQKFALFCQVRVSVRPELTLGFDGLLKSDTTSDSRKL